jgi:hypothetical protein
MKTLILLSLFFLSACSTSHFYEGTYKVASAKKLPRGQSYVKFEGVGKEFLLPTDTLKKGDLVYFVQKHK